MDDTYPQTQNRQVLRRPVRSIPQQTEERRERIKKWMAGCLIVCAFSIDLFEMLLEWLGIGVFGLSTLLSVMANILFWIWFMLLDVHYSSSPKNFVTMASTGTLELAPGLDGMGGFIWTAGVIFIVLTTMAEDRGGMIGKVAGIVQGKIKM